MQIYMFLKMYSQLNTFILQMEEFPPLHLQDMMASEMNDFLGFGFEAYLR